jgi:hypothetical protein
MLAATVMAALMGYTESRMRAVEDRGLDLPVRLQVAVAISSAVQVSTVREP